MVSSSVIAALIVNIVICFGMPIACLIYLVVKKAKPMIPAFVGIVAFIFFQLMLRLTIVNGFMGSTPWYAQMMESPLFAGLFVAFVSALFEEGGRWLGFRLALRDRLEWESGVAFGVGYAGIKGIILIGISLIGNLSIALSVNNGTFAEMTAVLTPAESEALFTQLTTLPTMEVAMSGLGQIFSFVIQIALTVLVLTAFKTKQLKYLGMAALAHLAVEAVPHILQYALNFSVYLLALYMALITVPAVLYLIHSYKSLHPIPHEEADGVRESDVTG